MTAQFFGEPSLSIVVIEGTGEPPDSGDRSESGVGSQLWSPAFLPIYPFPAVLLTVARMAPEGSRQD